MRISSQVVVTTLVVVAQSARRTGDNASTSNDRMSVVHRPPFKTLMEMVSEQLQAHRNRYDSGQFDSTLGQNVGPLIANYAHTTIESDLDSYFEEMFQYKYFTSSPAFNLIVDVHKKLTNIKGPVFLEQFQKPGSRRKKLKTHKKVYEPLMNDPLGVVRGILLKTKDQPQESANYLCRLDVLSTHMAYYTMCKPDILTDDGEPQTPWEEISLWIAKNQDTRRYMEAEDDIFHPDAIKDLQKQYDFWETRWNDWKVGSASDNQ